MLPEFIHLLILLWTSFLFVIVVLKWFTAYSSFSNIQLSNYLYNKFHYSSKLLTWNYIYKELTWWLSTVEQGSGVLWICVYVILWSGFNSVLWHLNTLFHGSAMLIILPIILTSVLYLDSFLDSRPKIYSMAEQ